MDFIKGLLLILLYIALGVATTIVNSYFAYLYFAANETFMGISFTIITTIFVIIFINMTIKLFKGTLHPEQNPLPPDQIQQRTCMTIEQQKKELDLREEQLQLDKKKLQLEQEIQSMQQAQQPNQQPPPPEPPKQQPPPKTDSWEDPWPDPDKE